MATSKFYPRSGGKNCHHGKKPFYKDGTMVVVPWGVRHKPRPKADLFIGLGEDPHRTEDPIDGDSPLVERLVERLYPPVKEVVFLDWMDMGTPMLETWEEWEIFFDELFWYSKERSEELGRPFVVVPHCYGGHGRTGTFLCLFVWYCHNHNRTTGYKGGSVVKFVRENYCKHAVESRPQLLYLMQVGVPVSTEDFPPEPKPKKGKGGAPSWTTKGGSW